MNKLNIKKLKESINEIIKAKKIIHETEITVDNIDCLDMLLYQYSSVVARELDIEIKEALIFSVILNNSVKGLLIPVSEVCEFFKMDLPMIPDVIRILNSLEKRGLVSKEDKDQFGFDKNYYVPDIASNIILDGQLSCNTRSLRTCLQDLSKILAQVVKNPNILKKFQQEILAAINKIQQPDFKEILDSDIESNSIIILFSLIAANQLQSDRNNISFDNSLLEILIATNTDLGHINTFLTGRGNLFDKELIKVHGRFDEGIFFSLGKHGRKILFGNSLLQNSRPEKRKSELFDIIQPSDIIVKKLFFEGSTKSETDKLLKLTDENIFKTFLEKMDKINGRKGLTCIFHGDPGTGKTEFVLQLAKNSNRALCKVDISSIRSKWIGETEENAKKIFGDYYNISKKSANTPILLFNESDALITKRSQVSTSADMMNNAMQNIFLEQLENFNGILIATSNLISNMDSAFDRRFLFKIYFPKPSQEIRKNILKEKLPLVNDETINAISENYCFSGGELENIIRKIEIFELTDNRLPTQEELINICNTENELRKNKYASIGFRN